METTERPWTGGVCGRVLSCRMKRLSDLETYRRRGQEVWRLILHRGHARLWWFRQTVAVTTCSETEMGGWVGGEREGGDLRQRGLLSSSVFKHRQFLSPRGCKQIHKGSKATAEAWQWDSSGAAASSPVLTREDEDEASSAETRHWNWHVCVDAIETKQMASSACLVFAIIFKGPIRNISQAVLAKEPWSASDRLLCCWVVAFWTHGDFVYLRYVPRTIWKGKTQDLMTSVCKMPLKENSTFRYFVRMGELNQITRNSWLHSACIPPRIVFFTMFRSWKERFDLVGQKKHRVRIILFKLDDPAPAWWIWFWFWCLANVQSWFWVFISVVSWFIL